MTSAGNLAAGKEVVNTGWLVFCLFSQTKLFWVRAQSCLPLCNPGSVALQAPLSVGFSRQEYWSELPFPPPEDLPNPGIKPVSPALQEDSLPLSHLGNLSSSGLVLLFLEL